MHLADLNAKSEQYVSDAGGVKFLEQVTLSIKIINFIIVIIQTCVVVWTK